MALRPKMRNSNVGLFMFQDVEDKVKSYEMHLRGLHETIYERSSEASRAHGRGKSDEHVHAIVELWVDTERGESLGTALAKADVA